MVDFGDRHFDPKQGMLRLPVECFGELSARHFDDAHKHPVRESLHYALVLLELAERSLQGRAEAIIARVIELQANSDTSAELAGRWPFFCGEENGGLRDARFDQAESIGMTLLLIWHRHRRRLKTGSVDGMVRAIEGAAASIRCGELDIYHPDTAIQGAFVMLSAAEVTTDPVLLAEALGRLRKLRDSVAKDAKFVERCTPSRMAISLAGLHAIESYVRDPAAAALLTPLLAEFWKHALSHFHPGASGGKIPPGPSGSGFGHASSALEFLIEKASRGVVSCPSPKESRAFDAIYACVVNVMEAPIDVVEIFSTRMNAAR